MSGAPETAAGMAAAVAAGEVSPVELTERALGRLGRWQPVTNAFSQVYVDESVAEARTLEGSGEPGLLRGVPVAVKDLFDIAGKETTGCCAAYRGNIASADSEMIRRLRGAGAVIVGKTNQHELACGATNLVSACGATRNPWDPERITGGSSGGSGAALASGVVPIALGTDTGGSIRMPSSFCGCWGLKPTTGRLPTGGMMPLAPSLDCPGPMAGTARDLALAWSVLAESPVGSQPRAPRRVGVLAGWFDQLHPDVVEAVEAAEATFESLGADIVPVDGDGIEDVLEVWRRVAWAEFYDVHGQLLRRRELLAPRVARNLEVGAALSPDERAAARARAAEFGDWFRERLEGMDFLLSATTPYPAPKADQDHVEMGDAFAIDVHAGGPAWFTEPVNLAGLPAIAVPAGISPDGLPLSVQIIGKAGEDERLLEAALALEDADERYRARVAPFPGNP